MELTKDQIEKAAEAAYMRYREVDAERRRTIHSWKLLHSSVQNDWCDAVEAAAPFLQMPIADFTEEEIVATSNMLGVQCYVVKCVLSAFRSRYNATLQPKPDLREQVLVAELRSWDLLAEDKHSYSDDAYVNRARRFLAVIDAQKDPSDLERIQQSYSSGGQRCAHKGEKS